DLDNLHPRALECTFKVMCDVDNPLLGERGAATIFGPQKGATPAAVKRLDVGLQRLSGILSVGKKESIATLPRGGAAGGIAAALYGLLNAELVSGIEHFLNKTDFEETLSGAAILIT